MPLLRTIERRIEAIFEGAFGRAFRAHVQPVELARKLAKEMDDHRTASVTRVYVPNEYTVYLSPDDHDQFSSYEEALCKELQEYLSEHAQREHYALPSAPHVVIETDEDLEIGVFGIATKMARTAQDVPIPEPAPTPSFETTAFSPDIPIDAGAASYALVYPGGRFPLQGDVIALGRARECENSPLRSQHLSTARGDPLGRRLLRGRRSRLDEWNRAQRAAGQERPPFRWRRDSHRADRADLRAGVEMALASTSVDGVLLALKIAFIVLLYVFIWRVIRAASRRCELPRTASRPLH